VFNFTGEKISERHFKKDPVVNNMKKRLARALQSNDLVGHQHLGGKYPPNAFFSVCL